MAHQMTALLFIILAVILFVVFSKMAIYVAGSVLGILAVIIIFITKRRKRQ